MSWNRRFIGAGVALAATCLTAGCVDIAQGDIGEIYRAAKGLWNGGEAVTLEEAASVPYASIGVRLGGSSEMMLILATDSGGRQLWTSSARIAITTDNGRIVRTAGFGYDLGGYESRKAITKDGEKTIRWQGDFPDLGLYSIPIVCRERARGDETIVILGKDIHTRRVDESCVAESGQLSWSFRNSYWLDPASGLVWRSVQHTHPRLDAITLEILRPPV
jgi:hypothetical protein